MYRIQIEMLSVGLRLDFVVKGKQETFEQRRCRAMINAPCFSKHGQNIIIIIYLFIYLRNTEY